MDLTCMDGLWVRRLMIVFLKDFPQVSSNTVGFCSVATGTPVKKTCDEPPNRAKPRLS
jgi:hypothetical protein